MGFSLVVGAVFPPLVGYRHEVGVDGVRVGVVMSFGTPAKSSCSHSRGLRRYGTLNKAGMCKNVHVGWGDSNTPVYEDACGG